MATITKETGTGSASATSYASEADFSSYNTERNVTLTANNGSASEILILAMDYLETKDFIGSKGSDAQALQWPRLGAFKDGYVIGSDSIPQVLLDAQMEIAISIDSGDNPMDNVPRETLSEKVGDIAVTYKASSHSSTYLLKAETLLRKLVRKHSVVYRA